MIRQQVSLDEMMSMGVTSCEAKSGYGLDKETEIKMLEVIKELGEKHPMDVVPTFLGPHAIPPEYEGRGDEYIEMTCKEILPEIRKRNLADYCDVFCEDSVFNAEQSRTYLKCARDMGFGLKIHADEIEAIGGTELAGELGAASAEHLIAITESGMDAMAEGGVTAMCLPATSFYLDILRAGGGILDTVGKTRQASKEELYDKTAGFSLNLQFVINLGCLKYKLTPEEVLTAVTINPACAIGLGEKVGTLEPGKQADLVIWNAPDFEMVCYRFGSNMTDRVIKKGTLVK